MTDNKLVKSDGRRKPPAAGCGRKKGSKNKTTVAMKEAIMSVYSDLQADKGGNHGHFKEWAENNPTQFYNIAAKLIPMQVGLSDPDGAPLTITFTRSESNAG